MTHVDPKCMSLLASGTHTTLFDLFSVKEFPCYLTDDSDQTHEKKTVFVDLSCPTFSGSASMEDALDAIFGESRIFFSPRIVCQSADSALVSLCFSINGFHLFSDLLSAIYIAL